MTQRGVPPVDPDDLRDHATSERIDRVWRRVAADISHGPVVARPPRGRYWVTAIAATLAAFGAGVFVGKGAPTRNESVLAVSSPDVAERLAPAEVFAAGSRGRRYSLPGGGAIELAPGSTVELIERNGTALRLRLVQGEATVDTAGAAPSQTFDIVAEDAVVSATTGTALKVSRTEDDLDVSVRHGEAEVRSPSGNRSLRAGDHAPSLPLRKRPTAARVPVVRPRASAARAFVDPPARAEVAPAPVVAAAADWREKRSSGDWDEALRLLRAQPGGVDGVIASASSAGELMDLSDLVIRSDAQAAIRAWTRIVDSFPNDGLAQIAAYKLGTMYEKLGQPERARIYLERVQGELAQDALCQRVRTAVNAGDKDESARVAAEYLAKYPDGRCREEAERAAAGETSQEEPAPPSDTDIEEEAPTAADAGAAH